MAIDSRNLSTPSACITLLGGVAAPAPVPNSMTPTGEIFPNHREWSIEFNKQFIRPPRARYIRIFEEGGSEVISINVKDSEAVEYPTAGNDGHTLKFFTNFTFSVNHTYYVLMDPGVAVGSEFCNAESPVLRDRTFWVVTVKDERPLISTCLFGDIRLVGGSAAYEGRVELCNDNGEWGTVCDDQWSQSDAIVACKQAGFLLNDVTVTATIRANFGEGTGLILLDDLQCSGEESNLFDCVHRGIGRHNCRHTEDAGVICKPCEEGELRLVEGLGVTNGRVEICLRERWGTVCGDTWGAMEVEVICRQLGYLEPDATSSYFGVRSGPINLYDLECTGAERNFTECVNKPSASNCSLPDVGVFCTVCSDGDVRLVGGANVSEGRVEVCFRYQWATICDRGWDDSDAGVVCGQLGFSLQGAVAVGNAGFGEGTGIILIDRVSCFGREDSILNCSNPGIFFHACTHMQDASVICQFCEDGEVRLVGGGPDITVGRVEVCLNKTWGRVCGDSWDETDARVVCNQLGYLNTSASVVSTFSQVSGSIIATRLECSGDELSFLECPFELDTSNCSHSSVAGVQCYVCLDGDIRLVNGSMANEGRVELCYNNLWGTVCDDGWDNIDASVACRQAGYSLADVTALATVGGSFGRGTGMILLDDTVCTGDESRLFNCSSRGIGIHNCGHSEDAGIVCKFCEDGDVRLTGGSSATNGIVEVCIAKVWGTVCADSWDLSDVQVVCRQLGYLESSSLVVLSRQSDSAASIGGVECTGEEDNILDCAYDLEISQCSNGSAALQCVVCSDGDVRLVDGSVPSEGRVEVCYNNQWGTVCDSGWDNSDASVACGQAGFSLSGAVARSRATFGQGSGLIFLVRVACLGREDSLLNCSHMHPGVGAQSCNHHQDAGVICQFCEDGEVRLVGGGSDLTVGRVEVCLNKTWGTVCDDSWDESDAGVVCNQLGYLRTNALAVPTASYGHSSGPILITRVECSGDEKSILECEHDLHTPYCSHSEDAGVRCTVCLEGGIRLVGGSTANEGRVELCYNSQWGTVCDDRWDNTDASVACRQAGFSSSNAAARHSGLFGRGVGHILLDEVACTGAESSLFNCPNRGIRIHNCGHHEDAGVTCTALEPFTLTFVNDTPRAEDNRISVDFITSQPMSSASCSLRNDQLKVNKNCTSGSVQFASLLSGYYIFRVEARNRERAAERVVIRRLLEVQDIPFTLTFVNNTPRVEGSHVSISFIASKPVYSATCHLGRSLRKNCTAGSVEFTDVKSASYVLRVVALDKERFGHKIIERRFIHVLGEGSLSCAVHLMNEGVTIDGRNVSITFVGIGPVESYFCRIDRSPFLPCSSPVEYNNLEHGIHTVRVKSQKCGENDKRLSFKITI